MNNTLTIKNTRDKIKSGTVKPQLQGRLVSLFWTKAYSLSHSRVQVYIKWSQPESGVNWYCVVFCMQKSDDSWGLNSLSLGPWDLWLWEITCKIYHTMSSREAFKCQTLFSAQGFLEALNNIPSALGALKNFQFLISKTHQDRCTKQLFHNCIQLS